MLKLTKEDEEYLRDNLSYDPETGKLWWVKPLSGRSISKPAGSYSQQGYLKVTIKLPSCQYYMQQHRVCWFLYYGSWPNSMLDHIDGDRANNKVINLRLASNQENQMNTKKRINSSSKYKGVYWDNERKKWSSGIEINQVRKRLGRYILEEDAARAYDKAAREHFGDYARLNFPEEHEQGALNGHDV